MLCLFKDILKLSAVRKVLETRWFLALGSFETLGSKLSHGTSWIAEIIHWIISPNVRTHLRKVLKRGISLTKNTEDVIPGVFIVIISHVLQVLLELSCLTLLYL